MALTPGTRVGPYEVVAPLGSGGMGEVYRARDTKLDRDVALKILPDLLAGDPDRLARFEREAKTLAVLNHANIAHVYDAGKSDAGAYLVMELVEGQDLSEIISGAHGPPPAGTAPGPSPALPLGDAIAIARQIAEALEAAHESGIVHRDLKPANIKVRPDGTVKVLDFGLAKVVQGDASRPGDPSPSISPTLTARATQLGMILGTAAYMAPEQAKGKAVDRRADMWAFGVVVYEMLTGRRAFEGGDISEVLASVIKDVPALEALPPDTPPSIRRLLRRCLEKDPRRRLADAGTARIELDEALAAADPAKAPASPDGSRRRIGGTVVAGALGLAALSALGAWFVKPAPPAVQAPLSRFAVTLPASMNWTRLTQRVIAMSRDGTRVAYAANSQLHVRALDQFESTVISGARDPVEVFFSPDGDWIGFYADGMIQKVALTGGAPVPLAPATAVTGLSWTKDDWIVYALQDSIMRVRASGGSPETIVTRAAGERFSSPQMLPDGRTLLFSTTRSSWEEGEIAVERLDTDERTVVVRGGSDARYLETGHLVYGRANDLYVVPFDPVTLTTGAAPVAMVNAVATAVAGISGTYQFAVSDTGTLAYLPGSAVSEVQMVWLNPSGDETVFAMEPGAVYPDVSPDGARVAFTASVAGNVDIYIRERARNARSRLTFDPARDLAPVWTPDSKRIVFASARDGAQNLYWQAADGTGTAERLTTSENDQYSYAVTPDGQTALYIEQGGATNYDIYAVSLTGDRAPRPLLVTPFDERRPSVSPDGNWMVYQSNESGSFELFVRPYPNVDGGRWQVSAGGGSSPIWSPAGGEIFYRQGTTIQRVPVTTTPVVSVGTPSPIATASLPVDGAGMTYAIDETGKAFLVVRPAGGAGGPVEFRLVLNWFEDIKARVR